MSILHSLLRASLIILLLLVKEGCIDSAYPMRQVLSNNLSLSPSSLTLQEYIHFPILYPSLAPLTDIHSKLRTSLPSTILLFYTPSSLMQFRH